MSSGVYIQVFRWL